MRHHATLAATTLAAAMLAARLLAGGLLVACGDDPPTGEPPPGDTAPGDDTATSGDDTGGDPGDDTGDEAPVLDAAHPGWRVPDCWSCHLADDHDRDLLPGDCAACHGTNGAPAGHGGTPPCADCHGAPHDPAESFPDPEGCQACHPASG